MSITIAQLKAERDRLYNEANKLSAAKAKLQGAKDEAGTLRHELVELASTEAANLQGWIASGRRGPRPETDHKKHEALAERLAALQNDATDAKTTLAEIEKAEHEMASRIAAVSNKFESSVLDAFCPEMETARLRVIETLREHYAAIADYNAAKVVGLEISKTF